MDEDSWYNLSIGEGWLGYNHLEGNQSSIFRGRDVLQGQ